MSMAQETIALSQIEKQRRGYLQLSLTNFDNLLEPEIAAGGRVEVGDSLFYAAGNESITGWAGIAVSTDVYIKLMPAGGTPDTCTAVFTDVAPTWSDSKQGYYGTGAAVNHRYIGGLYKDGSGNYASKWLYEGQLREGKTRPRLEKKLDIGDWNMDVQIGVQVPHGLNTAWKKICKIDVIIRLDGDTTRYKLEAQDGGDTGAGVQRITATSIDLIRKGAGMFDNVAFSTTSYNRGWVFVEYEA